MNLKNLLSGAFSLLSNNADLMKYAPNLVTAWQKVSAGGFQDSKADLLRAIEVAGVSKQQISGMFGLLNNPVASGLLNRLSPNLSNQLKGLEAEIGDAGHSFGSPGRMTQPNQTGGNMFPPLKKR